MPDLISFIKTYRLAILLAVSAIIRLLLAAITELGNDEVYYITYALYPEQSHFDHPPMVGWFMQIFTLNLVLDTELWIRLASIVSGTLSTVIIYYIGKKLGGRVTAWYSALMYNLSVYGFIITGVFAMPDSPQGLFWLLTIYLLMLSIESHKKSRMEGSDPRHITKSETNSMNWFLIAGVTSGMALLSKYTSVFLLSGTFIYFIKNREWFGKWYVYAGLLIAVCFFIPVFLWNLQFDFISFNFHTDRIEIEEQLFRPVSLATELVGQILYNNPFIVFMTVMAVVTYFRKKSKVDNDYSFLLVSIALPLILLFIVFSMFRSTLPHWTGPGYVTLIPMAALYLTNLQERRKVNKYFPGILKWAIGFTGFIILGALLQLYQGVFFNKGIDPKTGKRYGMKDITLDMYGWKQLNTKFTAIYNCDLSSGTMDKDAVIISHRWFPAANLDYYVARDKNIRVMTMAPVDRAHKYAWITEYRGGYKEGMDAYFISSSYDFKSPLELYTEYFTIGQPDTIPIYRKDLLVKQFYVWRMKDLRKIPSGFTITDSN